MFIKRNEPNSLSKNQKLWKYRGSIVYKLIENLDTFLSKKLTKKHVNAFVKKDYTSTNIPVVEVKPTPVFVNALPPAEYADPDVFEISFEVE